MGCYTYSNIVRLALSVFVIWPVCVGRLTAGAMIPPPKRVDSVEVYNDIKEPVTFKVFYENVKEQTEITEEYVVQPGQTYIFKEKELDMGSWQAVAPVIRVEAEGAQGGPQLLSPVVSGIVKVLRVSATESGVGGGLKLAQAP